MRVNGIIHGVLVIRVDQRVHLAIGTLSSSSIYMWFIVSK
jgi:hypothetical protein